MTVSYVGSNRRADLRAAALFVIDAERQAHGYDKRISGSAGVPDVIRIFDETLATFPLEDEVGDAIAALDEVPCWRDVVAAMEPIWTLWPTYSHQPDALLNTSDWNALRVAVQRCVDRHGLWYEEIDYPVSVVCSDRSLRFGSWRELKQLDRAMVAVARVVDARGRAIELRASPALLVRRVGLPPPVEP